MTWLHFLSAILDKEIAKCIPTSQQDTVKCFEMHYKEESHIKYTLFSEMLCLGKYNYFNVSNYFQILLLLDFKLGKKTLLLYFNILPFMGILNHTSHYNK